MAVLFPHATKRRRRSGFTLLEMVAALVLMTLLFAALTSLLRSFADQSQAMKRLAEANPPTQQLAELLRRDLTNARFVRSTPGSLSLVGNLAQDWATRSPTGRRAEVTYEIDTIAGESWLVRREVHLDAVSGQRSREEPLWRGATSIQLVTANEPSLRRPGVPPTIPGMASSPSRMQLIVHRDNQLPLVELHIVHHWEDS